MTGSRHRFPRIHRQPWYVLIASLMAFGLILSGLAISPDSVKGNDTKDITARQMDVTLDCEEGQQTWWHFIITSVNTDDYAAPQTIQVVFKNEGTVDVPLTHTAPPEGVEMPAGGRVAHYSITLDSSDTMQSATAQIYSAWGTSDDTITGWQGAQFNESGSQCIGAPDNGKGRIVVTKIAPLDPDQEFSFDPSYGDPFTLTDNGSHTSGQLDPSDADDPYTILETVPDGWRLTSITGSPTNSVTGDLDAGTADVTLGAGETVYVTFTNAPLGEIIVEKIADDAGEATFDFTVTGAGVAEGPISLGHQDTESISNLLPGEYTITEDLDNLPEGWVLGSITVSPGDNEESVNVEAGEAVVNVGAGDTVTVTFTNREDVPPEGPGQIMVEKIATGAPGDLEFFYSIEGGDLNVDPFPLSDGANRTFGNLEPGKYTVTELLDQLPGGWTLGSITVTPNNAMDSVTLDSGEVVVTLAADDSITVTFTNTPPDAGEITIEKDADPADTDQSFNFTGNLGAFSLGHGGSDTFDDLTYGDTYRVTETVPAGWTLDDIDCGDVTVSQVSNSVDITLLDEDITCTFFNVLEPVDEVGQIVVHKEVDGEADDEEFAFTFDGEGESDTFTLGDGDSETFSQLPAGEYAVVEALAQLPPGWNLTEISGTPAGAITDTLATGRADIQLAAGATVEVTFTNTPPEEPGVGTIVVEKIAEDASDATFDFTVTGGALDETFSLAHQETETFGDIDAGQYTVTELLDELPDGWSLGSITVTTNGATESVSVANGSVVVDLASGETITVTFTNDETIPIVDEPGEITVVKDALGAPEGATFPFSITGGDLDATTFSLGHEEARTFGNLAAGEYTVSELVDELPDGWVLGSIVVDPTSAAERIEIADGNAVVNLGEGQTVTITFVNDETIPIVDEPGEITVIKEADAAADDVSFPFSIQGEGLGLTRFSLGHDESQTFGNLASGQFTVSELLDEMPDGWTLGSITVSTDDSMRELSVQHGTVTLDLDPGETIRVMFTNDDTIPIVDEPFEITVVKKAEGAGVGVFFPFEVSGGDLDITQFWLGDGGTRTFGNLEPGTYTLAEMVGNLPGEWQLDDISVSPADRASAVNVETGRVDITGGAGDSIRVTFTNETDVTVPIEDEEIPVALPATGLGGAQAGHSSTGLVGILVLGLFALGARFGLQLRRSGSLMSG